MLLSLRYPQSHHSDGAIFLETTKKYAPSGVNAVIETAKINDHRIELDMGRTNKNHQETLESIKDAIYDLQIGPSEISLYRGDFPAYSVAFEARDGEAKEVIIPIPSMYTAICEALNATLNARRNRPA